MAYQNTQPLGSTIRGGGGGWRALSLMNSGKSKAPTGSDQSAALKAGAGPLSEKAATDYWTQRSQLGLGSSAYDRVASDLGYQNSFKGYTAGTGGTGGKASGNSY